MQIRLGELRRIVRSEIMLREGMGLDIDALANEVADRYEQAGGYDSLDPTQLAQDVFAKHDPKDIKRLNKQPQRADPSIERVANERGIPLNMLLAAFHDALQAAARAL